MLHEIVFPLLSSRGLSLVGCLARAHEQGKDRARLFAREHKTGRGHEMVSRRKAKTEQANVCESKREDERARERTCISRTCACTSTSARDRSLGGCVGQCVREQERGRESTHKHKCERQKSRRVRALGGGRPLADVADAPLLVSGWQIFVVLSWHPLPPHSQPQRPSYSLPHDYPPPLLPRLTLQAPLLNSRKSEAW